MAGSQKQYGLLVPKKINQGPLQPRLAVFGDVSDSDNEDGADWVKKALRKESEKGIQKKQTKFAMQRALEQDPSVYQYDEIYDKMEQKKIETKAIQKDREKKPRYIQSLMKQAERRKREQERRLEREIQKEREAESEEFKDKEEFITSAYRKKLEEFKKMDEEERRQDQIDALTDVSRQKDLTGFYRHLYKQTVGQEDSEDSLKIQQEEGDEAKCTVTNASGIAGTSRSGGKEQSERKTARHYRKRRNSSSESEKDENKKAKFNTNIDADSDFTGQSSGSDSSDNEEGKNKTQEKESTAGKGGKSEVYTSGSEDGEIRETDSAKIDSERKGNSELTKESKSEDKLKHDESERKEEDKNDEKEADKENISAKPEPQKCSIWEKRTVGAMFEAALARYFARKAAKSAG